MRAVPVPSLMSEGDALALLESGALLVTANNRLAREYQHRYDRVQQVKGRAVWETPWILPWSAWLRQCYDQCLAWAGADSNLPIPLNPLQEQGLWERVIYESSYSEALLQVASTAGTAQEAWQLWHAWRLPLESQASLVNEDTQAFLEWGRAFKAYCQANQWVDGARLPDVVAGMLPAEARFLPAVMIWAGFDEYTPQQQEFIVTLVEREITLWELSTQVEPEKTVQVKLTDTADEITLAARWARGRLEQFSKQRIGIIIPQLESVQVQVMRIFDDTFHPHAVLPGQEGIERIYNISLAQPLLDAPLVHSALLILELAKGSLSLAEAGALLRSPFLGEAQQEFSCRALLDADLRRTREATVSLEHLLAVAEKIACHCPALGERLRQFKAAIEQSPSNCSPSRWAEHFARWLQLLGWPGERPLNSGEHQTVSACRKAVEAFAGLDQVIPLLKQGAAIGKFRCLLKNTLFQPETPPAPVQVMGMLEAAGERFDAVWILGLHDGVWPSGPRPNPLLPTHLQRQYRLPHASAERELAYARIIMKRLLAGAAIIVVSYPSGEGDSDLRPSPLIADLEAIPPAALEIAAVEAYAVRIQPTGKQEWLMDERGPELKARSQVKGGAALLKAQAACPFRAFAEHRLGAVGLEESSTGLAALDQGILVHTALQFLWEQLKNQQALLACGAEDLQNIVAAAAKYAVDAQRKIRPQTFTEQFTAIEQERLEQMLLEWLEQDKQRKPFKVLQQEKRQPLSLGGLSLNIRADRIDQLESGERVIIDYKTGRPNPNHWFGERPEEPQLPLYRLAHKEAVAAILFGRVRRGEMSYLGIAREEGVAPGVPAFTGDTADSGLWESLFAQWEQALSALALEVRMGYAAVAPKDARSCDYCALPGLCRIAEISAASVEKREEEKKSDVKPSYPRCWDASTSAES